MVAQRQFSRSGPLADSTPHGAERILTTGAGPRQIALVRLKRIAGRKATWLILAAAFFLLSIGLASHLAGGTDRSAYVRCADGVCTDATMTRRTPAANEDPAATIDWPVLAVGSLTALAIFGTWGLVARNPRDSRRIALLFIGTFPVHVLLAGFAAWVSEPLPAFDHDIAVLGPARPFALICSGLLFFQCLVQFGFVFTQTVCRLFCLLPFAKSQPQS